MSLHYYCLVWREGKLVQPSCRAGNTCLHEVLESRCQVVWLARGGDPEFVVLTLLVYIAALVLTVVFHCIESVCVCVCVFTDGQTVGIFVRGMQNPKQLAKDETTHSLSEIVHYSNKCTPITSFYWFLLAPPPFVVCCGGVCSCESVMCASSSSFTCGRECSCREKRCQSSAMPVQTRWEQPLSAHKAQQVRRQ